MGHPKMYFGIAFALNFYILSSFYLFKFFDKEDYRRRVVAAEVLNEETVERLESHLGDVADENVESSKEISVSTDLSLHKLPTELLEYFSEE